MATLCRLLGVSRSGYYAWRTRPPSARARANQELTRHIREVHEQSRGTYGAPRIWAELRDRGVVCSRKRVARLLRLAGLQGCHRRKGPAAPRRTPGPPPAPDLVQRQFTAAAPDRLWVADITYVPTWAGFLYLAVVLDVHSRRIVGWAMADHLRSELVIEAVDMAVWRRRPTAGRHPSLGPRQPVHEPGFRTATARSWALRINGQSWRLLRQRDGRELLRHPRMRAARPSPFPDAKRCPTRPLRLHRGVLQHPPQAFGARVSVPCRVREEVVASASRHLAATCPPNRGNSKVRWIVSWAVSADAVC